MNEPTTLDELETPTDATLAASMGLGNEVNLDVILDVPVTMAMEVGRTRISIRNLLQLNQGSVVELDGGSLDTRDANVAYWHQWPDEYDLVIQKWDEFLNA